MKKPTQNIVTTNLMKNSHDRGCDRLGFLLVGLMTGLVMLACFGLSTPAWAICQEGCDTVHANTLLGDNALVNNNLGNDNTAIGAGALQDNTEGGGNTATGDSALASNMTGGSNTANGNLALARPFGVASKGRVAQISST